MRAIAKAFEAGVLLGNDTAVLERGALHEQRGKSQAPAPAGALRVQAAARGSSELGRRPNVPRDMLWALVKDRPQGAP